MFLLNRIDIYNYCIPLVIKYSSSLIKCFISSSSFPLVYLVEVESIEIVLDRKKILVERADACLIKRQHHRDDQYGENRRVKSSRGTQRIE